MKLSVSAVIPCKQPVSQLFGNFDLSSLWFSTTANPSVFQELDILLLCPFLGK